ncbi:MAG: hypothetical protein OXF89_10680 [Rhodospirillaceae bacterium]|nr:hypothetical protein [Rhodospirillaceae bacterium]
MPRPFRCVYALIVAVLLGGSVCWAPAARAQWTVGDWTGNSYIDRAGSFSHCIMSAKYNSGITLYFLLFRNHDLFIGVAAPDWSLNPHSPYTMTMAIDGKVIRSAPGTVLRYDTNRLWLALGKDRSIRERLRWGLKLRLLQGKREYGFQLTGTAAALKRLVECVERGNTPTPDKRQGEPPAANPDKNSQTGQ